MSVNKFYIYLSSVYRIGIIGIVIFMDVLSGFNYETEKLVVYAIFGLYAVVFSVLRVNKWIAFIELIGIVFLLYSFKAPALHFLFIIPFTNFVSSDAKKMDILLFGSIATAYIYYKTGEPVFTVILSIGFFMALYTFHQRFNLIERLNNELYRVKDEINEYREEINTQRLGFEITTKMFYHMRELSEAETEEEVVKKMIFGTKSFFNAIYVCMYTKDEEEDVYRRTVENGKGTRYNAPDEIADADEERESVFTADMMRIPIYSNGVDWGLVAVYGKRMAVGHEGQMVVSPFNETDFETMLTYIYSVTKRITELQISNQNFFLANNDSLTRMPNRRYFWEHLERVKGLADRGDSFAVLVMDIDNFKSFNDNYGHLVGDRVLKIVAETISEVVRQTDVVGRLGGEEFGVILHRPNGEAMMVAERIRKMVAAIPAVSQITLSIGLAYYGKDGKTLDELMMNADAAMYRAKTTGKNQVVAFDESMSMKES